ncbi:uncharacterized protein LOC135486896 [Lineus longissimus]|uniref:uncharacterized protein LOC135486896 n=1 Tax=Lineus longissimus TaxID=88925 RepID=UPI002B4D9899
MRSLDNTSSLILPEYLHTKMEQSCPYSALANYQSLKLAQGVQQKHLGAGKLLSRRSIRAQAQQNRISSASREIPDVFNNLRVLKDQTFLTNILTPTKSQTSKLPNGLIDSSPLKSTNISSFKDFRDQQGPCSNLVVDDDITNISSNGRQNSRSPTRIKVFTPTPKGSERYHSKKGRRSNSAYNGRDKNKTSADAIQGLTTEPHPLDAQATVIGSEKYRMVQIGLQNNAKIGDVMTEIDRLTAHPGIVSSQGQTLLPEINTEGADTYESFITTFSRDAGNYTHTMAVTDFASRKGVLPRASPLHAHYERNEAMKAEEGQRDSEFPKKLGRQVGRNGKLDFRYMKRYNSETLKVPEVPSCLRRTRKPIWHAETSKQTRPDRPSSTQSDSSMRARVSSVQKPDLVAIPPEMEFYRYKVPSPFNQDVPLTYKSTKPINDNGAHDVEPIKIKVPTMAAFMSDQSSRETGSEYSKESRSNSANVSDTPSKGKQAERADLQIVGVTFSPSSGDIGDNRLNDQLDDENEEVLEGQTSVGLNNLKNNSNGLSSASNRTTRSHQRSNSRPTSQMSKKSHLNSQPKSCDPSLDIRSVQISSRSSTPRTKPTRTPSPVRTVDHPDWSGETRDVGENYNSEDSERDKDDMNSDELTVTKVNDVDNINNTSDVNIADDVDNEVTQVGDNLFNQSSENVAENLSNNNVHKSLGSAKNPKMPNAMFDMNAYDGFQHSKFRRDTDSRRSNRVVYNDETKVKYLKVKVGEPGSGNKGLEDGVGFQS